MARYVAVSRVPGLTEEKFRSALERVRDWRFERRSWIIKAYFDPSKGEVISECETPEKDRFVEWLEKTGWKTDEILDVTLVHEAGSIWPV